MRVKADRREAEKKPYSQTGAEMGIESEFIFCQKDGRWMRHQCHGFKELNKNRKVEHTGLELKGCIKNTGKRRVCSISTHPQHVLQHLKLGLIIREEYGIK